MKHAAAVAPQRDLYLRCSLKWGPWGRKKFAGPGEFEQKAVSAKLYI